MQKDKERVKELVKSKLTTTMIYPLSQFEEAFGDIWGINKDNDELTEQEKINKEAWQIIRQNILDVGNREIRSITSELNKYDINYRGNTTIVHFIQGKGK